MLRLLRNASIAKKLSLLTILAVSVSLCLCCSAFLISDVSTLRAAKHRQVESLARVLGQNTVSALEFDDASAAERTLHSLSSLPGIENAVLYNSRGDVFATYSAGAGAENHRTDGEFIKIVHRIPSLDGGELVSMTGGLAESFRGEADVADGASSEDGLDGSDGGDFIGQIVIRASTKDISTQIAEKTKVACGVLVGSLLIGVGFSWYFRRAITIPIDHLVTATRHVAKQSDYSYRVRKYGDDELGVLSNAFNGMLSELQFNRQQLQRANDGLELRVGERTRELIEANSELHREMAEREALQEELVTASRHAGMSEIATGVLHNVGNVLNSVNVSARIVVDKLQESRVASLEKATDLITQHEDDLGTFFASDERGVQLPHFLSVLTAYLIGERDEQQEELRSLMGNIDHIMEIISAQQSYARVRGMTESLDVLSLVRDALKINDPAMTRRGITVETDFGDVPRIIAEKHKILQILVNLFGNAKHALYMAEQEEKKLTVVVKAEADVVSVSVRDNGVGIAKENLEKIFAHGFTTKKDGHGFGLHSSALAANEVGGSLSVCSDGLGKGAVFTLTLPKLAEKTV